MAKKTKVKIPKSVLDLKRSPKQFAKKHNIRIKGKGFSKGEKKRAKKRLAKEYAANAASGLNKAVKILAENPTGGKKIEKVQAAVDNVISNPKVMGRVASLYRKHPEQYPHMQFLPKMIMNTLNYYASDSISDEEKEIGQNLDAEGLITFCEKVLRKQIKKYKSEGLSQNVAFQLATAIPTARLLKNRYWYRQLIQQMYDVAATEEVNVDMVLRAIPKIDKKRQIAKKDLMHGFFSEFILTKNTNKSHSYTETQKELNETLIDMALEYMNGLKPRKLRDMLKQYIKRRKTAESYKNDTKRVIKFVDHAHSNSSYTTIKSVVQDLINENAQNELYLG